MPNLRFGKGQTSLILLVMLVGVVTLLLITNTYSSTKKIEKQERELLLTKMQSYFEMAKGFSRNALLVAVHKAVQDVAAHGGEIPYTSGMTRSWICNGADKSPSVKEVRYHLSRYSLMLLNNFTNNFKVDDIVKVNLGKFKCVDFDVSESTVGSGENDEGFHAGAYGSVLNVSYDSYLLNSTNDVYDWFGKIRFWYLYRKFKEWVRGAAGEYIACVCRCTPLICGCKQTSGECSKCGKFYSCLVDCKKRLLSELQQEFAGDEYVECDATISCCEMQLSACETPPTACKPWENPPRCGGCSFTPSSELCVESIQVKEGKLFFPKAGEGECSGECKFWGEPKSAVRMNFYCIDKKYLLSTGGSSGNRRLIFSVDAVAQVRNYCVEKADCYCKTIKCEQEAICKCPLDRWCPGYGCEGECTPAECKKSTTTTTTYPRTPRPRPPSSPPQPPEN